MESRIHHGFLVPRAPPVRRNAPVTPAATRAPPATRASTRTTCSTERHRTDGRVMMEPAHAPGRDRLSALPDNVLRRIMSFLNARQSVQTCVLSRRWRHLWRSLPRINADYTEFCFACLDEKKEKVQEARFKKFVSTLLLRRDPVPLLDKFWLRYQVSDGNNNEKASAEAGLWISHALQLQTPGRGDYLRKLGLSNAYLRMGFFEQLSRGCPQLEDVFLNDCIILDDEISSTTLKTLNIYASRFSEDYRASISTPSLTSLTLYKPDASVPSLKDMKSLVSASIILDDNTDIHELLMSLSGVRNLDLECPQKMVTIAKNTQWCPEFKDLVNLSLGQFCLGSKLYALTEFLKNSPKLEKLTLDPPEVIIDKLEERSFECEHLKIVEVICSEDDSTLLKLVEDIFVTCGMSSLQINRKSSYKQYQMIFSDLITTVRLHKNMRNDKRIMHSLVTSRQYDHAVCWMSLDTTFCICKMQDN
uniref:F-box domain-containing protein n=1 Tax=Oryza glumipatula TaxID=40148 RepID=A0A0E0B7E1_9ORYZ